MPIEALRYSNTYAVLKFLLIMLFLLPIGAVSWGVFKFFFWFIGLIVASIIIQINLGYYRTSFMVNDNELVFNYGILVKHSKNVMLAKIQNVNVGQGMLEANFGIKSIRIWTASQEQISNRNKEINVTPAVVLHLKNEDVESFKSLLNKS